MLLAFYSEKICREIHLSDTYDQEQDIVLKAAAFGLKRNIPLKFEVLGGSWTFRKSGYYNVSAGRTPYEGLPLSDGQVIRLQTCDGDQFVILVSSEKNGVAVYRKFYVTGKQVLVGRDARNDLCMEFGSFIAGRHFLIDYSGRKAYLKTDSKNTVYKNNKIIRGTGELAFGDVISIFGLSLIYFGHIIAVRAVRETAVNRNVLTELSGEKGELRHSAAAGKREAETTVHISPRVFPQLFQDEEVIDNVPAKREEDKRPAWMTVLPPLTMVLPMLLGYLMLRGGMMMGIVISVGSGIVGVSWAIINLSYARKTNREREALRLSRYSAYLADRNERIKYKYDYNRQALLGLYPDAETVSRYTARSAGIWARKPQEPDFLFLRLGTGEAPFQVQIKAPVRGFAMEDDDLAERPQRIAKYYEMMTGVPLGVNITEHSAIGILTDNMPERAYSIMQMLLAQIAANHSYTDVKIAAVYDRNSPYARYFRDFRWLPHVWNEERSFRFLASDQVERQEVFYELTQILRKRMEDLKESQIRKMSFIPHYVVFVEQTAMLEGEAVSHYLYRYGASLGFTVILFESAYQRLPDACSLVIEERRNFQGTYKISDEGNSYTPVRFDLISPGSVSAMAKRMCGFRVFQAEGNRDIPTTLTFFDMMGVRRPEELCALENWRRGRTYESMKVVIGQKAGGLNCYLDIHEKYHGPHGLMAGTTGSGKSETLQTYILSLAVNFSPRDIGLFIIDFKGAGMANLFKDLPHTMGHISNLSGNQIRRAMVSIKSENMRRQALFAQYGVNHIDQYTRLVKNHEAAELMPHLLIVIDEFAELKREQPDFMRELISISQTGRSTGIHLILATQKPAGTVDDNIWSNTKFKICLRVADKLDSNDMLHRPDAAYLTNPGRGYLQVGNDEIFELFQSGWSGAPYEEGVSDGTNAAVLIDLQGREEKIPRVRKEGGPKKTQLDAVVEYLAATAESSGMTNPHTLWMPVLPERITLEELPGFAEGAYHDGRYRQHEGGFELRALMGLADHPEAQKQFPLVLDFEKRGHLAVVGGVTSGKSTFLQTLVFSLITKYSPEELNIYIIDYSSQMLVPFEDDAHVGGVVTEGEDDRLKKLFVLIGGLLAERKRLIRGSNFSQYRLRGEQMLPAVLIVLDGYANFREKTADAFENELLELSRVAEGYGIYLAISCAGFGSGELQPKIADNIRQKICLELADKFRYGEALGSMRFDILPEENVRGRGLASLEEGILEYQTAAAVSAGSDMERADIIRECAKRMSDAWHGSRARTIPEIPEHPVWEDIAALPEYRERIRSRSALPLGWIQRDATLYYIRLDQTFCYLILGSPRSGKSTLLRTAALAASDTGGKVFLIDTDKRSEEQTAGLTKCTYAADAKSRFEAVKSLINITNERAPRRKELLQQGYDDEEIAARMAMEYPPAFFLIADLSEFLADAYRDIEGVGKLSPWIENIFEKGSLLNVFIIGAVGTDKVSSVSDKPAWFSFIKEKKGMLLGGELNRQSVFSYNNVPYKDQGKKWKAGFGFAVSSRDEREVDLVVLPQNKVPRL